MLINNVESRDILTNNKMHGNTIVIKTTTELKQKYVCSEIIWQTISSYKNNLKENPYLEAVALRFIFVWNAGEIEDRALISTEFFFQRPRTNKPETFCIIPFKDYMLI